ncbi:SusC/RagA family TonB-linked outer membrane protein [Leeuwenhoekiella sp. H156]|uniref:SusC/RagA family TonB-linked outer membrane protein n=1 Tax=Leeuwenhoekiella sp. H156 TaxID=3450128 RepID=UPI003FA4CF84
MIYSTYESVHRRWVPLLIIMFFLCFMSLSAQKTITGTVADENGTFLPGANVIVPNTSIGVVTDFDGQYSIEIPENAERLKFSYLGYISREEQINGRSVINIKLQSDATGLDEIVVVGYGTQKASEITGSISTVKAEEMADIPVQQVTQKIQGKVSGVQISQTSGVPGSGLSVRIRGQASISAGNGPLYVVDGFPINGGIGSLNPNEIESISILKDAASASLYGSRAANGVVLVTTKSAKLGKSSLSVNSYWGMQTVPQRGRPDLLNAREFAQFKKEIAEENGQTVNPAYENPEIYGEGTDWFDVLLRNAEIQEHTLSFSSRNDFAGVSVVGSIFDQEGVLLNTKYNRYSIRVNSDFKIGDHIKFGFNVAPSVESDRNFNTDGSWLGGSIIQSALLTTPIAPHINPDGTIPLTATGPGLFPNPNWYNVLKQSQGRAENLNLLSNSFVEIEFLRGLKLKSSIGFELRRSNGKTFRNSQLGSLFAPPPNVISASRSFSSYNSWLTEQLLSYTRTFGKHNIDALIGFTAQEAKEEGLSGSASQFPDDLIKDFSAAPRDQRDADDYLTEWSLVSYLSRINYNYDNKYFLSASFRRDGSSRFGVENRYGNFPSFSGGWTLSNEDFFPEDSKISYLKLRGSWGIVGNNNIGNYTHRALVGTSNTAFGNSIVSGRTVFGIGNSELSWEQTAALDLGVDLGFFDNRLNLEYSYYNKNTQDLLYSIPIPLASGYGSILTNMGEIKFWGHELALNTAIVDKDDFKVNLNLNYTFSDNEVLALDTGDRELISDAHITRIGSRLGQLYGLDLIGVYVDQEDFDSGPTPHSPATVGSEKFRDVDGDGVVERFDDRTVLGNPIPTSYYGFTLSIDYKRFDFSVVGSGAAGHSIVNAIETYTGNLDGVFNVNRRVLDRWRSPSDPGAGYYGNTLAGYTFPGRDWFNDRAIYKGDYLAIRNITLGYSIPVERIEYLNKLRIYASVQQAFMFTKYPGANPEVGGAGNPLYQGFDNTTYPVPRTVTLGLNLNF